MRKHHSLLSDLPFIFVSPKDTERFWTFVDKKDFGTCWEWKGGKNIRGYGRFWLNGKLEQAHRVSYSIALGCIYEGKHVLHTCDNTGCVNSNHLFLGTHQENMRDKIAKGRQSIGEEITRNRNHARGDRNGKRKNIKNKQRALKILELKRSNPTWPQHKIAGIVGVSQSYVGMVLQGKRWGNLHDKSP